MKKTSILIAAIALLLGFTACERGFVEMNTNPNEPTEVPNTNVLLSSITAGIDYIGDDRFNMTYAGLWAQHYAKIQYIDEDKYAYRPADMDFYWTALYAGPLYNCQDIINNTDDTQPNMKAAAMVLKAYYMSVIADVWGSVPSSEALQGSDELTPVFDTQEVVYGDLIQMLADAAAMFDPNADELGSGDVLYDGDVAQWEKLANSLRIRLLMRTSGRDAGAAAEAMNIFNNEPVFTSNADNAMLTYPGDATYSNPIYENKYVDGRDDHSVSKTLVDLMNAGGFSSVMDPRLPIFAETNDAGVYQGQPNGDVEPLNFGDISRIGAGFRDDATAPVYVITYPELLFFVAEANSDKQAYLDGIAASHDMHGATADATYLADADAAYDANATKAIAEQKWIHLFSNGAEAFSEVRRLDFPVLIEAPQSVYPGQGVPMRFPYASTEQLTNGENLNAAISSQGLGASQLFTKVWWDVN